MCEQISKMVGRLVKIKALLCLSMAFLISFSACKKVGPELIEVESLSIDKTSIQLKVGETVTLSATVNPSNASDKTVTWYSSDASIATVEEGKITALKLGTATITAKAGDKTASCTVKVLSDALDDWEEGEPIEGGI